MQLKQGFLSGFPLHYGGPRVQIISKNLVSASQNPSALQEKIQKEIELGRIMGPFKKLPLSNMRISPIGLVPKHDGGWRMIMHLSHPPGNSVNDYIDPVMCSVQYTSFDKVVEMVAELGKGAYLGKMDIRSAFRLLPIFPGDFDLLGFQFDGQFYIDKMLPMGASISCSIWEKFATFLQWLVTYKSGLCTIEHYLDDFIFAGTKDTFTCHHLMSYFSGTCQELGVPIAQDKTVGPVTVLTFLGLELDTNNMLIRIPGNKLQELLELLRYVSTKKKITLKELQSLTGALNFFCKAVRPGRAFLRRLYDLMRGVKQPHHHLRLNRGVQADIQMWLQFLHNFNGRLYFPDKDWSSHEVLKLYTDSAGSSDLGCGAYLAGEWVHFSWPTHWRRLHFISDITLLELIPIVLAVILWGEKLANKKIIFRTDNMALVYVLNKQTCKSEHTLYLIRYLVLFSMRHNILFRAIHIKGVNNAIADSLSRKHWQRFRELAPTAKRIPEQIPDIFLNLICSMK